MTVGAVFSAFVFLAVVRRLIPRSAERRHSATPTRAGNRRDTTTAPYRIALLVATACPARMAGIGGDQSLGHANHHGAA